MLTSKGACIIWSKPTLVNKYTVKTLIPHPYICTSQDKMLYSSDCYIMETFSATLPYIQIALSILLVSAILMQKSAAGLGGAFGGDGSSVGHHTRRGMERLLFNATIVIAVLFVTSAFTALFI